MVTSINISDKYKCIFIHVPRAAGTSIKEALELPGRGHPPWQYYYLVYPEQWDSYIKFAVVRNPWDRVVSAYSFAKMEKSYWHDNLKRVTPHPDYELLAKKTFADCCKILRDRRTLLKHEAWHPQHVWVAKKENGNHSLMVDIILRHENLENDFQTLCEKLGIQNSHLPRINPSNHERYRTCYTEETKRIIAEVYATDIELFNYDF
jgi:chondroitin 4-sulfotransferase 11